jgi:hypothetical protein
MPNEKVSQKPSITTPTSDDLVYLVNDPAGTPSSGQASLTNLTKAIPAVIGDSGAGGTKGLVPAPGAGDAAAGKFLKADGTFAVPPGTGGGLTADSVSAPVFAADAGASDTYVATLSPVPSGYTTGTHYRFKANTANTGACTINFNSLGAKTIKKAAGGITTDLADNDIRAGQWVDLIYDGTNMQMQSTLGNAGGGGISGLTTGTIPKATSSTAIGDSAISDSSPEIIISTRDLKVRQIYSQTPVTSLEFVLDRSNGLRLGSDNAGFGFADAYFDNIGRHSGFLKIVSTATGGAGTLVHVPRTYAQFTANQNDFDISDNYWMRWSSDASRDITGMRAINDPFSGRQANGETHLLTNNGSQNIVIKHESASSTAVNRFLCPGAADLTLGPNEQADIIYDGDAAVQRWRINKRP